MSFIDFVCLFKQTFLIILFTNKSFTTLKPTEADKSSWMHPNEITGPLRSQTLFLLQENKKTFFYSTDHERQQFRENML